MPDHVKTSPITSIAVASLGVLLATTAAVVIWGATVASDGSTPLPGTALAGLLVAAVVGVAGGGFMAHAALRPDRWTRTSVLAAAFAAASECS